MGYIAVLVPQNKVLSVSYKSLKTVTMFLSNGLYSRIVVSIVPFCSILYLTAYILFQAGIPGDSLSIALEPECASVYCQRLTSTNWKDNNSSLFSAGKKYIVVDLGGKMAFSNFIYIN